MQRTEMPSMFYGAKRDIFEKAKSLRENMTPAESELWNKLNKSQLGFRFKAQHPIDIFIADFYCHQAKLVVEIDGGIHMHQTEYDLGRTAEMENYGIRVIRFSNYDIFNNINIVLEEIKKQLKYSVSHPLTP